MDADQDYKGHREMISAWSRVVASIPDARLLIVGAGTGLASLKAAAAQSPAADRIEFRGFVAEADMPELWRSAHVFALPSRNEGFGIVYVEAMRYGLPVIASIHDAGREVNIDGITGYNVDLEHKCDLPEKLFHLLKSPDEARAMGQAGWQRWHDHFRFSAFASRLRGSLSDFVDLPERPTSST
jgi:phosphatidylinositol alpha-1,6-mannosyltransferase